MNSYKKDNNINYSFPEDLIKKYTSNIKTPKNKNITNTNENKKNKKLKNTDNEYLINNIIDNDTGTVVWFDEKKGIGFIASDFDKSIKYLFHIEDIENIFYHRIIDRGFKLKFKIKKDKDILRAYDIDILEVPKTEKETTKIECPNCYKLIIPRVVFRDGFPKESICPFCGETIKIF